jgi:pimeloyl-ACP methyl ester carboxylesterase
MVSPLFLALFVLAAAAPGARSDVFARKGYLGAEVRPVTDRERDKQKLEDDNGVVVDRLLPESSAALAGLKPGDILISLDGKRIASPSQFIESLAARRPGETLTIVLVRDGEQTTTKAALKPIPAETSDAYRVIYGSVSSQGKRLRTIVTRPNDDQKHPALLVIQGLGSFSIESVPGRPGPYVRIIDEFAHHGFVTMRVDKPGQGDSEGGPTRDMDFETELDGYRQTLLALKGLDFVDPDKVIIFGHSMGGVMGPLLGAEIAVKGIAVYGTAARTWHEYTQENVRRQMALGGSGFAEIDRALRKEADIDHYIKEGLSPSEIALKYPDLKGQIADRYAEGKYHAGTHYEYFRQLAAKNLAEAWGKFGGRTMAAWGKADFISGEEDHALIARIINRAHPGYGVFLTLDGIDHGFSRALSQNDSFKNFRKPDREYNPVFLDALRDWASKVVRE